LIWTLLRFTLPSDPHIIRSLNCHSRTFHATCCGQMRAASRVFSVRAFGGAAVLTCKSTKRKFPALPSLPQLRQRPHFSTPPEPGRPRRPMAQPAAASGARKGSESAKQSVQGARERMFTLPVALGLTNDILSVVFRHPHEHALCPYIRLRDALPPSLIDPSLLNPTMNAQGCLQRRSWALRSRVKRWFSHGGCSSATALCASRRTTAAR